MLRSPRPCGHGAVGFTVVFAGDSITAADRSDAAPLGTGYVAMVAAALRRRTGDGARCHNAGVAGDTVQQLAARWDHDVLARHPTCVVVLIGINDIHREVVEGLPAAEEEFRRTYGRLAAATANRGARLLLLDPFLVGRREAMDEPHRAMFDRLPAYHAAVAQVAAEVGATVVPLHMSFQRRLGRVPAERLAPEPVHPGPAGHRLIASGVASAVTATAVRA